MKTTTKYSKGDRVQVKTGVGHDNMTMGKTGVVVKIATPALGVKFDGMPKVHKWYADSEVKPAPKPAKPKK